MKRKRLLSILFYLQFCVLSALMSQTFVHPGILHKESDFARMREKIAKHEEPWYTTWNNLLNSGGSSLSFYRGVPAEIYRPSTGTQAGPTYLFENATAAYQNALIYRISGDQAHAQKAVALLNEQAAKNTFIGGNADRFLAGGLFGYQFANAAEMMRGYPGFDEAQFKKYLTDVFMYPIVGQFLFAINGGAAHNGACCTNYRVNWDACNMAAAAAIAIFCDNKEWYDMTVDYFKNDCSNGNISRAVNFIQPGENGEPDLGQWEESGRDQGHTCGGMAEYGLFLEMAWNQGDDLFGYDDSRFRKGAEYVAKFNIMANGVGKYTLPYTSYTRQMGTTCTLYTESNVSESGRGARSSYLSQVLNHYQYRAKVPFAKVKYMAEALPGQYSGNYDGGFEGTSTDNYDQPGFGNLTYTLDSTSSVFPWTSMDIAARSTALLPNYGKTSLVGSTLTVKGSGAGVNGSSDFCQFAFQPLFDDGSIVVKMSSLNEVNAFCQSGLMMRESLEQNSTNLFLSLSTAQGVIFSSRDVAGGTTSNIASNNVLKTVPCWLRLLRAGNVFTAVVSSDSINWVVVGSKT
ncbi:MAG TPA: alginate lyase family protein, partial [Paludibacter sp.]